jgi:hypothetical protein
MEILVCIADFITLSLLLAMLLFIVHTHLRAVEASVWMTYVRKWRIAFLTGMTMLMIRCVIPFLMMKLDSLSVRYSFFIKMILISELHVQRTVQKLTLIVYERINHMGGSVVQPAM